MPLPQTYLALCGVQQVSLMPFHLSCCLLVATVMLTSYQTSEIQIKDSKEVIVVTVHARIHY